MKSYFEEHGGTYTEVGQVLIPSLVMDEQPEGDIGVWGWRRKRYLKEHRKGIYNQMLMDGTITQHLIEINEQAMDMRERLVKQFQKAEGVTEDLKRKDQMAWVGVMNSIYNRVDEIILHDLIYI
ncbi:MAG: TnpV protein [Clostridia bacterium]|nr:TnpV protein [Clostridia bacterium]